MRAHDTPTWSVYLYQRILLYIIIMCSAEGRVSVKIWKQ